jgi:hypothetical protein
VSGIGVNRIKFSRLISVTSKSVRQARPLSKCFAAYSPANPLPVMMILVFFIFSGDSKGKIRSNRPVAGPCSNDPV